MAARRDDRAYRFEPLDSAGVFLGLGVVQCALLGAGLVTAVLALSAGLPLPLAALPVLASAGTSFGRLGGHPVWEWLPLGASWAWMLAGRGRRWTARLPLVTTEPADAPVPPCLAGLSLLDLPWRGWRAIGAIRDGQRHTLTALVPVSGGQFTLASRPEQERLVAGWGDVLNQYAVERGIVTHLCWSDFARPSGMAGHRAWLGDTGHASADGPYGELLDRATTAATDHEILVTLTVARDRLGRRGRRLADPQAPLADALVTAVDGLLRALHAAGLTPADPLDAGQVCRALRARIDPAASLVRLTGGRLVDRLALVTPASAGPLVLESSWRHVRVDGAVHRTYWVACWPRLAVPPSWLEPFLSVAAGVTRTMTVVFRPVPAYQSRRRIERELVRLESDAQVKEEKGRRVDARHRRATQALLDREQELVAGYAEMAYTGLLTVHAPNETVLDEHAEIVEQAARAAGIELRPLDGRHDLGWAAALPFGLAPKTLLAA